MNTEQFDETLRLASCDVNFGPMNGFGGYGSEKVWANLPAPLQAVYRKWNIPIAILAGYAPGKAVRCYAEACGIDVAGDLAKCEAQNAEVSHGDADNVGEILLGGLRG